MSHEAPRNVFEIVLSDEAQRMAAAVGEETKLDSAEAKKRSKAAKRAAAVAADEAQSFNPMAAFGSLFKQGSGELTPAPGICPLREARHRNCQREPGPQTQPRERGHRVERPIADLRHTQWERATHSRLGPHTVG